MKNPKEILQLLTARFQFLAFGISSVRKLEEEENHLHQWLQMGYHAEMGYMERNVDKRLDPTLLLPGAKSVITFLYNYYPEKTQKADAPIIARYAYGEDYHVVIKDKLHLLVKDLMAETGAFKYRIFVDSAPIMERQWAALSGLGWIGKNSLLLRKGVGSYFFIATIVCDLELEPDAPTTDHCGTCTACMDACPTQAIVADGVVDARKCISYLTIEQKELTDAETGKIIQDRIFGCDICQEACPWNQFSIANSEPRFAPGAWIEWSAEDWEQLNEVVFEETFSNSAINRAGFTKLRSSIKNRR